MIEQIYLGAAPRIGFGETVQSPKSSGSPWPMVLATSLVGAATTWMFEEIVQHAKKQVKRRR